MKTPAAYKAFGLGAALGLVVAFAPSCGGANFTCDATSCSTGCCQNGQCLAGTAVNSCGKGGAACSPCAAGKACTNQVCGSAFTGGGQGGGTGAGGGDGTMPCNAATCPSGCCSSATSCETGATASACGTGGSSCSVCTSTQTCTAKACVTSSVTDAGDERTDGGSTDAGTGATDAGRTDAGTVVTDGGRTDAGMTSGCNPAVVISQVYGAGGNSGALYNADYVELHNRTGAAINLNGWSLQYASATGSNLSVYHLRSTIAANGFLLLQTNDDAGTAMALPAPDQLPPILADDAGAKLNMGGSGGKIALVSNQVSMTGSLCAGGEAVVDWLGWGISTSSGNPPANCAEGGDGGTTGPISSATLAVFRKETTGTLACIDTNINSADFVTATPAPRNSASTPSACTCQ